MIEPHSWARQGEDVARAAVLARVRAKERKPRPLRMVLLLGHQSTMERTAKLLSCSTSAAQLGPARGGSCSGWGRPGGRAAARAHPGLTASAHSRENRQRLD